MQFFTIGQYFNKLYIGVLLIILLPIISFILVYTVGIDVATEPVLSFAELSYITIAVWLLMFAYFFKKIKSIAKDQGLGLKLTKYFYLTIVRSIVIAIACMVLVYGFYNSKDDRITVLFAANLFLVAIFWPRPAKVCRDLKLRGDEREMVYFKKDELS